MNDNIIEFPAAKIPEPVKPNRFYIEEQGSLYYILDRSYPQIDATHADVVWSSNKASAQNVCNTLNRRDKE